MQYLPSHIAEQLRKKLPADKQDTSWESLANDFPWYPVVHWLRAAEQPDSEEALQKAAIYSPETMRLHSWLHAEAASIFAFPELSPTEATFDGSETSDKSEILEKESSLSEPTEEAPAVSAFSSPMEAPFQQEILEAAPEEGLVQSALLQTEGDVDPEDSFSSIETEKQEVPDTAAAVVPEAEVTPNTTETEGEQEMVPATNTEEAVIAEVPESMLVPEDIPEKEAETSSTTDPEESESMEAEKAAVSSTDFFDGLPTHTEEGEEHWEDELEPDPEADDEADAPELPAFHLPDLKISAALTKENSTLSPIEPYHTVDYFASQGIKAGKAVSTDNGQKMERQVKSFTEWLRSMKKIGYQADPGYTDPLVEANALNSIQKETVVTETMAEIWLKQGDLPQAIQVFEKLMLLYPEKSHYFAARIKAIKEKQ